MVDARLVDASTAAVCGHPERLPVHETDRKTPTSPHGVSKLAGDYYDRTEGGHSDLPTVVLRYCNV